jgi:hypothetical protein
MKIIKIGSIVSENEKQITKETRKTAKVFNVNEINYTFNLVLLLA